MCLIATAFMGLVLLVVVAAVGVLMVVSRP